MRSEAKILTVGETCRIFCVSIDSTLYRLLKKQQLPGFKIGSDWRFNVEAIEQWRMQAAPPHEYHQTKIRPYIEGIWYFKPIFVAISMKATVLRSLRWSGLTTIKRRLNC
jgi:excisionase family DNA binding protein